MILSLKRSNYLLIGLFLVALVLCIKNINEPDIFWQIRAGEWILENGKVPTTDIFSFTFDGEPWNNVKWGSEVVFAIFTKLGGIEALIFLQIIVVFLILFSLIKTFRQFSYNLYAELIILLILLIGSAFRFNTRPEMFSHLFTAVYFFILVRHYYKNDRLIFALIPLQLIWANFHEGYGIGIAIQLIFLLSIFLETKLNKAKMSVKSPLSVFLASIFAVAIHPLGFKMISQPLEIFSQLSENNYTTELLSFTNKSYWKLHAFIALSVFLFVMIKYHFFKIFSLNFKKVIHHNAGNLFLILSFFAFYYLSLKSERNIPLFLIAASPLLYKSFINSKVLNKKIGYVLASLFSIIYLLIVSNKFYEVFYPNERYGWEIDYSKNPINAAEFVQANNIKGKAFTDYMVSSYLLWKLQPEFNTYIDLRDLDVFNQQMFDNVLNCYHQPDVLVNDGITLWQYFKQYDKFEYIVMLNRPEYEQFHKYIILKDNEFDAVYTDPLCTVYLNVNSYNSLVSQLGLKTSGNPIYNSFEINHKKSFYTLLSKAFNPFYKPHEYIEKYDYNLYSSGIYNYLGLYPSKNQQNISQ
jgi:hypothetical protein